MRYFYHRLLVVLYIMLLYVIFQSRLGRESYIIFSQGVALRGCENKTSNNVDPSTEATSTELSPLSIRTDPAHFEEIGPENRRVHEIITWLKSTPSSLYDIWYALTRTYHVGNRIRCISIRLTLGIALSLFLGTICSLYPSIFPYELHESKETTQLIIGLFTIGDLISRL